MNNERRKIILATFTRLDAMKDELERLVNDLDDVRNEEESARDNLPESLQQGEKGEVMQDNIDCIDEATLSIQNAVGELEEAMIRLAEASS